MPGYGTRCSDGGLISVREHDQKPLLFAQGRLQAISSSQQSVLTPSPQQLQPPQEAPQEDAPAPVGCDATRATGAPAAAALPTSDMAPTTRGLGTGALVGMAVAGAVVVLLLAGVLAALAVWRRRRQHRAPDAPIKQPVGQHLHLCSLSHFFWALVDFAQHHRAWHLKKQCM